MVRGIPVCTVSSKGILKLSLFSRTAHGSCELVLGVYKHFLQWHLHRQSTQVLNKESMLSFCRQTIYFPHQDTLITRYNNIMLDIKHCLGYILCTPHFGRWPVCFLRWWYKPSTVTTVRESRDKQDAKRHAVLVQAVTILTWMLEAPASNLRRDIQ